MRFESCALAYNVLVLLLFMAGIYISTLHSPLRGCRFTQINNGDFISTWQGGSDVGAAHAQQGPRTFVNSLTLDRARGLRGTFTRLVEEGVGPKHPGLVTLVRQILDYPRATGGMLKVHPRGLEKTPMAALIDSIFRQMRGGYFVECGAYDGETGSTTLYLEARKNWTGLLMEPDPYFYTQLLGKNRRAYHLNACASPNGFPAQDRSQMGRLVSYDVLGNQSTPGHVRQVPCFPLETALVALAPTRVHYLSLSVGGLELEVLRTLTLDRLEIPVISVPRKTQEAVVDFLAKRNYLLLQERQPRKLESLLGQVDHLVFVDGDFWEDANPVIDTGFLLNY